MADEPTPVVSTTDVDVEEKGNKWYAWTTIHYGAEVDQKTGHMIKRLSVNAGEVVTKSKLGVDDKEWNELVEQKIVRRAPYPKIGRYQSPKRHLIAEAAKAMEIAQAGGE